MPVPRLFVFILSVAILAACGRPVSLSSSPAQARGVTTVRPGKALEVPPGLVDTSGTIITSASKLETENNSGQQDGSGVATRSATLVTKIRQDAARTWLEIDAAPDRVWQRLVTFWQGVGVNLVVAKPAEGVMETDWFETLQSSDRPRMLGSVLNDLVRPGRSFDKYKVELNRVDPERTNLFISHRATKRTLVSHQAREPVVKWEEAPADPKKEREMLQALAYELDPSNVLGG